ncbi:hypothetical protein R5W24_004624 [Gemmata sp. JC717]|uniref:hypothetical protein n=1 Tax=Gemmata algarum TaxID=2975278 RepID=UPI0021BA7BAD|nr:hypothetical protein [Gemmata algarum]MDY3555481.1 hypothetical protein [Gemmata algarum]
MRFTPGRLLAPALFLATGLMVVTGGAAGQPAKDKEPGKEKKDKDKGPKDGPKGGPEKGAKELRKAFDGITEIAQTAPAGKDAARLLDHAKAFYRAALNAHPDDPRRAGELALAVNDAVRGLEHLRRSSFQPVAGVPEPPLDRDGPPAPKDGPKGKGAPPPPKDGPKGRDDAQAERGPWSPSLDALTTVQDQFAGTDAPPKGAGRDFFDTAKIVYRQARTAYEAGDYRKAAELARAAGAWLRVNEHLARAEWDGAAVPPAAPEPKGKGAPPLPPIKE